MEPITTTLVAIYVSQKFVDYFLKEVEKESFGRIKKMMFPKQKYVERLRQLIYETIEEYERIHPVDFPNDKIGFYQSTIVVEKLTTVLLKNKLTTEFKFELQKNPNIVIPNEQQLKSFLDILADKIKNDKKIKKLYIEENYQAEIFEISSTLNRIDEKIDILLARSNDSNVLDLLKDSYLKDLDYPTELMESYKPQQALDYLLQFKTNKWEVSDNIIKYKLLANIGQCYLQLHKENEAANFFIEAEEYNPDSNKALGFYALGYALKNDRTEFNRIYNKAIQLGDVSDLVYSSLIMINNAESSIDILLAQIPENIQQNSQVAFAVARHLKQQGNLDDCISWMEIAINNSPKNQVVLKGQLGSYILEMVCTQQMFITQQVNKTSKEYIHKAINLLTESWGNITEHELKKSNYFLILNRGVGKKFLGDFDGAYFDIKEASKYNDEFITSRHLGIVSWEVGKRDESIDVFEKIVHDKSDLVEEYGVDLMLISCYIELNQTDKAVSLIDIIINSNTSQLRKSEARTLLIDIYIETGNLEDAKKENESIIEQVPDSVIGYLNKARIAHIEKNDQNGYLQEALNRINETTRIDHINVIGNYAYRHMKYNIAITCYEKIVDKDVPSDILTNLLKSYYEEGLYDKVISICENLRIKGAFIQYYVELEVLIYQKISDIPKAIGICESFLIEDPDNIAINARLAGLYLESGNIEPGKRALLKIKTIEEISLDGQFQISWLHIGSGLYERGLEFLYSSWRNNQNTLEVHDRYVQFLFQLPQEALYLLDVQEINVGTAVTFKANGNHITQLIVATQTDRIRQELNISDEFAKNLIGKKVGEIVEVNDKMGIVKTIEITGIKSKYNFAREKSLQFIESTVTNSNGIRVLKIEGNTKEERGDSMMNLMNNLTKDISQQDNELIDFYKSGALTIGLFANAKNRNEIEVWAGVTADEEMGLFSTNCIQNEYILAQNKLLDDYPIVLDYTSVLSLDALGAIETLENLQNRLIIPQALINCFRDYLNENKKLVASGKMNISQKDGKIAVHQITGEQISNQINKIQRLLDWMNKKCEVLPTNELINLDPDERKQLFQLAENISSEAILLAKEHNGLLLADETTIRLIGWEKMKIQGSNTQMLLRALMESDIITRQQYDVYSLKLISLNYWGLMLEPSTLIQSIKDANYSISELFIKASSILNGSNSDENSAVYVAVLFFKEMYLLVKDQLILSSIIVHIMEVLTINRNPSIVISKLNVFIEREFNLLPIQKSDLISLINKWYNNH